MITFNRLLEIEGVDLECARIVRHSDSKKAKKGCRPVDLWRANDGRLERYQSVQKVGKLKGVRWLAAFVATELNETVFVGVWEVVGPATTPQSQCPVTGEDVSDLTRFEHFELTPTDILGEYKGRILIQWTGRELSWFRHAKNEQGMPVLAIRATMAEPPFPGFMSYSKNLSELPALPESWREPLRSARGVYLLVCESCGVQYVGAAYGADGFLGRWSCYLGDGSGNGHGGNEGMKEHHCSNFQVSILEVAGSTASADEICARENVWKKMLLTEKFGLNLNSSTRKQDIPSQSVTAVGV